VGGVAGHMSHLYDNPSLTFGKMKEILDSVSNAELKAEEKVDGQNLFLSYSLADGEAKAARNKTNLIEGGMNASELATKFSGRGALTEAFTNGFKAFSDSVSSLDDRTKQQIFGPDANIWYNAEIMDPGASNVINYDSKNIKIHDRGHFLFDREKRKKISPTEYNIDKHLQVLDSKLTELQNNLENSDFSLIRSAVTNLNKFADDNSLNQAKRRIDSEISRYGLNDSNTVGQYMKTRLMGGIDADLSPEKKENFVDYLLKLPTNIGLRQIKAGLTPAQKEDVSHMVNIKGMLLKEAIDPIEDIVHDFSVEVLRGMESLFIVDTQKETDRIRQILTQAVQKITDAGEENPENIDILQKQLNKIKDLSNISTPVEGIVFDYDGHTYKFTGNFAPINQILGMFKYGRGTKQMVQEEGLSNITPLTEVSNVRTEKAKKFVQVLPKFTPTEAWGNPSSMEREQINKLFNVVGGGATFTEKLNFIKRTIENPSGKIESPRRIISTLIILESLSAVVKSFSSSAAGFVFEGFISALLRGKQEAEISPQGNLPIQDLIAFSELPGVGDTPVSLKMLRQEGDIKGSYTNLVNGLNEFGDILYVVARKQGDNIELEQFLFTRDNFIDLIAKKSSGALNVKAKLLQLPKKSTKQSINILNKLEGDANWSDKYLLLQQTAGYTGKKDPKPEETEPEEPPAEEVEVETEEEVAVAAQRNETRTYTVQENRRLLKEHDLLLESKGGPQWAISPSQLNSSDPSVKFEKLGTLPVSADGIVKVAEQYMDYLGDSLTNLFEATQDLSQNVNEYFTYENRSDAISAGSDAIKDANRVAQEMSSQISSDRESPKTESIKTGSKNLLQEQDQTKTIGLFPGKFKPPHKGHLDLASKIARKVDELIVYISPIAIGNITPEKSAAVWEEFLKTPGTPDNIKVAISSNPSPVGMTYDFVEDPELAPAGSTVVTTKSSKDDLQGDARFNALVAYAKRKRGQDAPDIKTLVEDPLPNPSTGFAYSSSAFRDSVEKPNEKNKELFLDYMPEGSDVDTIWDILTNDIARKDENLNGDLDSFISKTLDEISTMGGGSVEGSSGSGFGPPNTYNVYTRNPRVKSKKPKVRRPKRSRRR
jgi:cytidyltransferase-like protein